MKMVVVYQSRTIWIAPTLGVEVQTKHKIRMQPCVYQHRATPNLAVAVEQDFALPADGFLLFWVSRIQNILLRLGYAVFDQDPSSKLLEIIGAFECHRVGIVSHKRNF